MAPPTRPCKRPGCKANGFALRSLIYNVTFRHNTKEMENAKKNVLKRTSLKKEEKIKASSMWGSFLGHSTSTSKANTLNDLKKEKQEKVRKKQEAKEEEERLDLDSDEHACGLIIDNSSELPPPAIIIEDRANIIADNKAQSFRSRMQYEETENIKDERAPSVPFPFRLDLSQIKELMLLPDHTPFSKTLRTDLLSPTGRRAKVVVESVLIWPYHGFVY